MTRQTTEVDFDFIIKRKGEGPSIGIELKAREDITDKVDQNFRDKLWRARLPHGILITRKRIRVYEDLLLGDGPKTYKGGDARTEDLLKLVARDQGDIKDADLYPALASQWLELLVENWGRAIPSHLTEPLICLVSSAADGELVKNSSLEAVKQ